jgi:hypothetical protein
MPNYKGGYLKTTNMELKEFMELMKETDTQKFEGRIFVYCEENDIYIVNIDDVISVQYLEDEVVIRETDVVGDSIDILEHRLDKWQYRGSRIFYTREK